MTSKGQARFQKDLRSDMRDALPNDAGNLPHENLKNRNEAEYAFISLQLPTRKESRRVSSSGHEGSQRSTREVFNRMYADRMGLSYDGEETSGPLTAAYVRNAATLIRTHLYAAVEDDKKRFSGMGLTCGKNTYRDVYISHAAGLERIRRALESQVGELKRAKFHWASISLIKEVLRRDRDRQLPSSRSNELVGEATSGLRNNMTHEMRAKAAPRQPCARKNNPVHFQTGRKRKAENSPRSRRHMAHSDDNSHAGSHNESDEDIVRKRRKQRSAEYIVGAKESTKLPKKSKMSRKTGMSSKARPARRRKEPANLAREIAERRRKRLPPRKLFSSEGESDDAEESVEEDSSDSFSC